MHDLWVEKYRPNTLDEFVWRDATMRAKAEEWITEGSLPNCLFAGTQGTGKTSMALLLLKLLNIPKGDIMYINASKERKAEDIQDRIGNFVGSWALGPSGIKYIILDEFDAVSIVSQKILRAEIEQYSDITRFLITANYQNKILPALISRLHVIPFKTLDKNDFIVRTGEILVREEVDFDIETLELYVKAAYPDLRKCISLIQQNTLSKKLQLPNQSDDNTNEDYKLAIIDLFKEHRFLEARKLVLSQIQPEEYTDFYRYLYQNLDFFGSTQDEQDDALLIIRRGVVNHTLVADVEINLSACLVELSRIKT